MGEALMSAFRKTGICYRVTTFLSASMCGWHDIELGTVMLVGKEEGAVSPSLLRKLEPFQFS